MAKIRAFKLANEFGIEFDELVTLANGAGIELKNKMTGIEDEDVIRLRNRMEKSKSEKVVEKRVGRKIIRRRAKKVPAKTKVVAPLKDEPAEKKELSEETPSTELPIEDIPVTEEQAVPEVQQEATAPVEESSDVETVAQEVEAKTEEAQAETKESAEEAVDSVEEAAETQAEGDVAAEKATEEGEGRKESPKGKKRSKKRRVEIVDDSTRSVKRIEPPKQIATIVKKIDLDELAPDMHSNDHRAPRGPAGGPRGGSRGISARPAANFQSPLDMPPPGKEDNRGRRRDSTGRGGGGEADRRDRGGSRKGGRRRQIIDDTYLERRARLAGKKRGRKQALKIPSKTEITTPKAAKRIVKMGAESIVISEFAKQVGVKANEVLAKLMNLGLMLTINQAIDQDVATLVAQEFGYEVESTAFEEKTFLEVEVKEKDEDLEERRPVVTVMGHVDHGKTSLLDRIRNAHVADQEAGGITQHIGAYKVPTSHGTLTFIDTPGHEAFTALRARGAQVTDVVILIVAADDGVMPQTIEAINHSKAAEVPIVVAINKIDKDNADPRRVRTDLMQHGLIAEELGGDTPMVEISAKKGIGIEALLELVAIQAELLELKANPNRKQAEGVVIESKLHRGHGAVATVLVQQGSLAIGDPFVCGIQAGRIKAMLDDRGRRIKEALPSDPVEVHGFSEVPEAGQQFITLKEDKKARLIADNRRLKKREEELAISSKVTLDNLFDKIKEGETKELALLIKADVQGSVEAVRDALAKLSNDEIRVNIIHTAVGGITESDVLLASASNAIIIGFNIRPETKAATLAEREKVDIRLYSVIYEAIEELQAAIAGMLAPIIKEESLGHVEVRDTFHIPKVGTIAGSYVMDGKIERGCKVRLLRDSVVIYTGRISSLRRFKEDTKEVVSGFECGIGIENYNDIKVGDVIEAYHEVEIAATL